MKTRIEKAVFGLALICATMMISGCFPGGTTSVVWRIKDYHPAHTSNLRLSTLPGTNDVLVQYDEQFAHSSRIKPRAYWLSAYAAIDTNSVQRPKPKFVNATSLTNLCRVAFIGTNISPPTNGFCAMPSSDNHSFKLWRIGTTPGEYTLPVYSNTPPATWWRVALTPVTVTTDAAIIVASCMPPL